VELISSIVLTPVNAFDATKSYEFAFQYEGQQSVSNRLTIYLAETNQAIYDQTQNTLRLSHTLPAETLSNGNSYICDITAYDIDGNGMTSSKHDFICLDTPRFWFTNITENQIVENSAYTAILQYAQIQGELINEYRVTLYSSQMSQLWDSGLRYAPLSPIALGGFINGYRYYIRATGTTVNGFYLDTGFIPFLINYKSSQFYSVLSLENRPKESAVRVTSNIIVIYGKTNPTPPTYIKNEIIDVMGDGNYVKFDEGFKLDGDFVIELIGYGFKENRSIVVLSDGYNHIELFWRRGNFVNDDETITDHLFVELVDSTNPNYIIFSNHLQASEITSPVVWRDMLSRTWGDMLTETWGDLLNLGDPIHVYLRRVNGLYEVKINEVV
jgi:hypothetical protein